MKRSPLRPLVLVLALLIATLPLTPLIAAVPQQIEFGSAAAILKWMNSYRSRPNPLRGASAIHELSQLGELRSQESSGVYVGFAAGLLSANPSKADALVARMLPLPPEDQWLLVRAIAYSGIPDWKEVLQRAAPKLTARGPMLQRYIKGELPTLANYEMQAEPEGWVKRTAAYLTFSGEKKKDRLVLEPSAELLDAFWGFYFATGSTAPLQHIIELLGWAKDRDDVTRLTIGSMAKYTLAENASRDPVLLATLRTVRASEPKDTQEVLGQVIEAAENVEVTRLRADMLAALDELKRKGPATKRDVTLWGQLGQGAVAAGCIAAAVAGQVALGIPCVVGGAVSSGLLNMWTSQQ